MILVSVSILFAMYPRQPGRSADAQLPIAHTLEDTTSMSQPGFPVRIKIPKISVDGAVEHVGLTSQNDLASPKADKNAGWYKQGPRPGESGSAVIGGHFGLVKNKPALFDNLHQLQKGDKIFITDNAGTTMTFIVTGSRLYAPAENATAVFRSSPGTTRLNLVTCQGDWDSNKRTYTSRLVVFSEKQQAQ